VGPPRRPSRLHAGWPYAFIAGAALARSASALTFGGDVAATSDYIFRGVSLTDNQAAAQADLHATTSGGTFIGVFSSTLRDRRERETDVELEAYLGHRFDLSPVWNATLTAVSYSYLDGHRSSSTDYQELSASASYLDRWTVSFTAAPNIVRYYEHRRLGRYAAYIADVAGQLPLAGRMFLTGGVGYYSFTGPDGSGYTYGNAGLAFEYQSWRLDAGYYLTDSNAQALIPYSRRAHRFAATLSWHF